MKPSLFLYPPNQLLRQLAGSSGDDRHVALLTESEVAMAANVVAAGVENDTA